MTTTQIHLLSSLSVVDILGADATAILHNLTTNDVKSLEVGQGCESFVTNVRGKTLAHFHIFRREDGFRLIGAPGLAAHRQSESFAAHADRYTIREDAAVTIRDEEFVGFLFASLPSAPHEDPLTWWDGSLGETPGSTYRVRWLNDTSWLVLVARRDLDAAMATFDEGLTTKLGDESSFDHARTVAGYPWYGIDIDDSNLPQEINREDFTISFTKGCYLGQETVARLDALGQVQKKRVRLSIEGTLPAPGTTLDADGKTVVRLTSVTKIADDQGLAIGFARRTHFDPGATAQGSDCVATVIE
ncbi:tRNA-modifying protein YgfZ [Novipirellula galeiformis]|uniref:tRNA-modifying protein YgfZ n=1 Tax=Novipirellula galeiformis TaxID=2528004 RepID=A0A5C6C108_9BACT|nr:folate-binding protein YgfZ [Novipirellula galeiformis]TWU17657.1 tRNA-modifying protein YgfZ [Novipirellula galeiformis]